MLFFREAQRVQKRQRRDRIVDTNAAMQARDGGKALLRALNEDT